MPVLAGAVSAGMATAAAAFRYNRGNYLFDSGMRFGRYTTGYSFTITQALMYRDDIRDLTALTVNKQDTYHVVSVIFFVLNFQLIMAGRQGLGGPAPPGWVLGLFWGNISSALMFLLVCTWLSMHASARATAGGAHMLTRSVRLPIPTPRQLDKARRTGNSFERQRVTDVFRVPFVAPAPKDVSQADEADAESPSKKIQGVGPAKGTRRMPKWYQDETQELHTTSGPTLTPGSVPEHFESYRALQQEWWGHDVYSRIGLLYFITHWLLGVNIYSQCYCIAEQRQVWPAIMVTLVFSMVHHTVLRCDIVTHDRGSQWWDIRVERVAPFLPLIVAFGMVLEYSVLTPTAGCKAFIYLLSWVCYGLQLAWALRLYDLAQPHQQAEQPEAPGQPWWPAEWWLPVAFQNAVYLVAPPKFLEPGQTCLQQEMRARKSGKGEPLLQKKPKEVSPMLFPWKAFRGAIITTISMWVFIMFARLFEQAHGERALLKQEGRMERWPASVQPWMPPWTRRGTRNEWAHSGGSDRRLEEVQGAQKAVQNTARGLLSVLVPLVEALEGKQTLAAPSARRAIRYTVAWPASLRPHHLVSAAGHLVAVDSHGRGALLPLPDDTEQATMLEAAPFELQGLSGLGELLGATWFGSGLLAVTSSGAVVECTGASASMGWPCRPAAPELPLGGSALLSASVARAPAAATPAATSAATSPATPGSLRAAVAYADEPGSVLLLEAPGPEGPWLPAGGVSVLLPALPRLPAGGSGPSVSLGLARLVFSEAADELLALGRTGSALRWRLSAGAPEPLSPGPLASQLAWRAAAPLPDGRVAHLVSPAGDSAAAPELLLSVLQP